VFIYLSLFVRAYDMRYVSILRERKIIKALLFLTKFRTMASDQLIERWCKDHATRM
jgi:hypothetical protein